jgi:hypothetical protein
VTGCATIRSSLSELLRLIVGAGFSARRPRPIDDDECGRRFPLIASRPADTSRWFARSLSDRSRSLSWTRCVLWARCFSISFHNCEFCCCWLVSHFPLGCFLVTYEGVALIDYLLQGLLGIASASPQNRVYIQYARRLVSRAATPWATQPGRRNTLHWRRTVRYAGPGGTRRR